MKQRRKPTLRTPDEIRQECQARLSADIRSLAGESRRGDPGVRFTEDGYIVMASLWSGEPPRPNRRAVNPSPRTRRYVVEGHDPRAPILAHTKSEARARLKQLMGLKRLWPGVKLVRVG